MATKTWLIFFMPMFRHVLLFRTWPWYWKKSKLSWGIWLNLSLTLQYFRSLSLNTCRIQDVTPRFLCKSSVLHMYTIHPDHFPFNLVTVHKYRNSYMRINVSGEYNIGSNGLLLKSEMRWLISISWLCQAQSWSQDVVSIYCVPFILEVGSQSWE